MRTLWSAAKAIICACIMWIGLVSPARAGVLMACFELEESGGSTGDQSQFDLLAFDEPEADSSGDGFGLLGTYGVDGALGSDLFSSFLSGSPGGGGLSGGGGGTTTPSLYEPPTLLTNEPLMPSGPEWMPGIDNEEAEGDSPPANQVIATPEPATLVIYALGLFSVATVSAARRTRRRWPAPACPVSRVANDV